MRVYDLQAFMKIVGEQRSSEQRISLLLATFLQAAIGVDTNIEQKAIAALDSISNHQRLSLLLMLWTAPPPARECQECGCCRDHCRNSHGH
jgi:hypothetical protein